MVQRIRSPCRSAHIGGTVNYARGAAYLAGLAVGFWSGIDELRGQWEADRTFTPQSDKEKVEMLKKAWAEAVERTLNRTLWK